MGKEYFNYAIIVCARAEERCPKTFPGVGTTFSWIFEDPRRDEDLPYDSMLERFRAVRDQIELRMKVWLEHPEEELRKQLTIPFHADIARTSQLIGRNLDHWR